MSSKCVVGDESLLKNLTDQRVRELLGNHIPQDEAKLLSNGRLTCTICLHRPVFDTINMLANHRRGKRHSYELSKYIKCKEEVERKTIKRKYEYPNNTTIDVLHKMMKKSEPLAKSSLLGYKHVAKQNMLKYQRKKILEVRKPLKKTLQNPDLNCQDNVEKKALTTVKHYLKNMARKTSLEKVVERNRENYGVDLQKDIHESPHNTSVTKSEPDVSQSGIKTASETQNYEINLRMNGWIKDFTGKWIKDPNVEFDSDEDETPPPP